MMHLGNVREFVSTAYGCLAGILLVWTLQTSVALGTAWVAGKIDPSHSAATRYRIWMIALLACGALIPLSLLFRSMPAADARLAPMPIVSIEPAIQAPGLAITGHTPLIWSALAIVVPALWIAGVLLSLGRLSISLWRLSKIKSGAERISVEKLGCDDVDFAAGPAQKAPIMLSTEVQSPGLAGVFRPVILLPADVISWTSPAERSAMVRHELAHIERRDPLTGLFVSFMRAILFFHPVVHLAANRIGLERELACDEKVMLGTDPNVYAESILKAVGRRIVPDWVHHAPSFASKKTLERRLREILTSADKPGPRRQWRFLPIPVALILVTVWLVMPAASVPAVVSASGGSGAWRTGGATALSTARAAGGDLGSTVVRQSVPVVDGNSIWVDTVKRGNMRIEIAGLGNVTSTVPGHNTVRLVIPGWGRALLKLGQRAIVSLNSGPSSVPEAGRGALSGVVASIDFRSDAPVEDVKVNLDSNFPASVAGGAPVQGVIDLEQQLDEVLSIGRPVFGQPNSTIGLFKLNPDGKRAVRVQVQLGAASWNRIQILSGLDEGDRVIISDSSRFENAREISIK